MSDAFKPFAFDREFAADGTVLRDGEKIKKVLTEEEARALADAAAQEARKSEEAEAANAAAEALRQVAGKLQACTPGWTRRAKPCARTRRGWRWRPRARSPGAALEQYGVETIEACVTEALADLRAEPRIAVRVAPHLADPVAERLYAFAEAEGLEGAVVVRADEDVSVGDCVIEWRAGAIERSGSEIEARIAEAVGKWLVDPHAEAGSDGAADTTSDGQAA